MLRSALRNTARPRPAIPLLRHSHPVQAMLPAPVRQLLRMLELLVHLAFLLSKTPSMEIVPLKEKETQPKRLSTTSKVPGAGATST